MGLVFIARKQVNVSLTVLVGEIMNTRDVRFVSTSTLFVTVLSALLVNGIKQSKRAPSHTTKILLSELRKNENCKL